MRRGGRRAYAVRIRRLLFSALVALAFAVPPSAAASFPGANGDIAFASFPPGAHEPLVGIVEPDGSNPRTITSGGEAQWSPDGSRLAYTLSSDATGIGFINADGSGQQTLFPAEPGSPSHPSWFPDGETLGAMSGTGGFVTIDIATKTITPVAENTLFPLVSPNGELVAFQRSGDLWIMNADGSGQRLLATGGVRPDFSPTSTQVVFERGGNLFVIDVDGSDERLLVTGGSAPVWSPDGRLIAFSRNGEIWVIATDGTGQRQLAANPGDEIPSDWQRVTAPAPDCSKVKASPKTLWPPNNKLRTVRLLHPAGTTIDPEEVRLRARKGAVYKVRFTLTNAAGATCSGTVTVRVKKPRRR